MTMSARNSTLAELFTMIPNEAGVSANKRFIADRSRLKTVCPGGWAHQQIIKVGYFQQVVQNTLVAEETFSIMPISAVLLSYMILGKAIAWSHLWGASCVLAGIGFIAQRNYRQGCWIKRNLPANAWRNYLLVSICRVFWVWSKWKTCN